MENSAVMIESCRGAAVCGMYEPALESMLDWWFITDFYLSQFSMEYQPLPKTLSGTQVTTTTSTSPPPVPRHFQTKSSVGFYKCTSSWNAISVHSAPGPLVLKRRPLYLELVLSLEKSKLSGEIASSAPSPFKFSCVCTIASFPLVLKEMFPLFPNLKCSPLFSQVHFSIMY